MDPVTLFLIPAFVGGVGIAFLLIRTHPKSYPKLASEASEQSVSTDVINMSRIRVSGLGGLGLVAMAVAVAFFIPQIGVTLAISLVLGVAFGAILIVWRRRVS